MNHTTRSDANHTAHRRPGPIAALGLAVLLATSACSSGSGAKKHGARPSTVSAHNTSTPTTAAATTPTPNAADAAAGPATNYVIHYASADGTQITVTFALHTSVHDTDATLTSFFPSGIPCEADNQRDAIFAGTMTVSNDTPGFTAALKLGIGADLNPPAGSSLSVGVGYSNGGQCLDINGANSNDQPAIVPTLGSTNTWGPVPIEFVVHGAYTPLSPLGDPTVLTPNLPMLTAYNGTDSSAQQYNPASQSSTVTSGIQGNVYLNLTPLL